MAAPRQVTILSWITATFLSTTLLTPNTVECVPAFHESNTTYMAARNRMLFDEASRVIGANLPLNDKERAVNEILLSAKSTEFQQGFQETFPPTINFLLGKPLIDKSKVFDIIKRMPKGGILHAHDISVVDPDWVIQNVTYLPHLYFCVDTGYFSGMRFMFSDTPPTKKLAQCRAMWKLVASERAEMLPGEFDKLLFSNITMFVADPDKAYPNATVVWTRFLQALLSLTDLYFTVPVFKPFIKESLREMVADNVQYLELRTLLAPIREVNGIVHSQEYTMQQYIEAIEEFKAEHSKDFAGMKIISSAIRQPLNRTLISQQVKVAVEMRRKYPDHFLGFDLVSQEDGGGPLIAYINELLLPSQEGFNLPFFFHAGETNWEGTFVDENLIDALLLNTTRIGHGYAINKHPVVMEMVKSKGIAIEINPVSNQVLHLVHDLRDHIGAGLIADNYPVVVSSDDPSVWGALPLSHDYYLAFMGMSGETTGLRLLKQLALNTFKYSAMSEAEKVVAMAMWQKKWDAFLDEVLAKYGNL